MLDRSLDHSRDRSLDCSIARSIAREIARLIARSLARSLAPPLARSIVHSIARLVARSLVRSLDRSRDRSRDRSLLRLTAGLANELFRWLEFRIKDILKNEFVVRVSNCWRAPRLFPTPPNYDRTFVLFQKQSHRGTTRVININGYKQLIISAIIKLHGNALLLGL